MALRRMLAAVAVTGVLAGLAVAGPVGPGSALGAVVAGQDIPAKVVITATPSKTPPGQTITVSGTGLVALQKVTVMLNGQAIGGAETNATGAFKAPSTIPASTKPARYTIGVVYSSGKVAGVVSVLVSTEWPQFGDTAGNTRYNQYENILSAGNVAGLTSKWSYSFPDPTSSPAVTTGTVYLGSWDDNV